ncbi:hypothetical protein [Formosa maritima]|uniref:Uncharacterized protein n=1 Tax=Formosa maritima TaxID=2592046 RepID=A0A5D0G678_9FLAO|nr:hypothetical protein [Formosa maritima]TYA53819.1 hypothetical protein FVF61_09400 [Formosa maritima]
MSKLNLKITFIALSLTLFNCKKESTEFENFKFANEENILICENLDTKLYVEALLSFEDDIALYYDEKNKNIRRAHSFYFRDAIANRAKYEEFVSPHTMEVFESLKQDKYLWNEDNSINYNADIFTCLSSNFKVEGLQTTFNALVSTNSMSPELFGAPLKAHVKNAHEDRYMATYIALDLFYAKLFNVDPATITERTGSTLNNKIKNLPAINAAKVNQENAVKIEQKESQE